jgi:hypothetical protein
MLTKVIDAHPDIVVLMENNFGNCRRLWEKTGSWDKSETLGKEVESMYSHLEQPVIGNKVCTPDVWSAGDINMFCRLFKDFRILFLVRDPMEVALSRFERETDYSAVYSEAGRENILLDFESRFHTYISSWRQSIENYWKLRETFKDKVKIVYYEDLCNRFKKQIIKIFKFLDVEFSDQVLEWYKYPHVNSKGNLVRDLKYKDAPVFSNTSRKCPKELANVLKTVKWQFKLWKNRKL